MEKDLKNIIPFNNEIIDTGYKDLNGKSICVGDVFSIVNGNFKASYMLKDIKGKGFGCMVGRKDQGDKFVPIEKFIKKHGVTIEYTAEEYKEKSRKDSIKNIQSRIREERIKITKSQQELSHLRNLLKSLSENNFGNYPFIL